MILKMNVGSTRKIMFKDIYNPDDYNYNTYLKGKVAILVDYRIIIPEELFLISDHMTLDDYINSGKVFWDSYKDPSITEFIDIQETARLNDIFLEHRIPHGYEGIGKFWIVPEKKIPLSELKNFRKWLACSLDVFTKKDEEVWKHVLHYYMEDMYDDVIRWLSIFGDGTEIKYKPRERNCGCASHPTYPPESDVSDSAATLIQCNSINMYRTGMYNSMVDRFSSVQFWACLPESFLKQFKRYIEGILLSGLTIDLGTTHKSVYAPCDCDGSTSMGIMYYKGILERLSQSLAYIIHKDVTGHLNFISKALREWSSLLYERMSW